MDEIVEMGNKQKREAGTLRDGTDPARVQTGTDTSLNIQTKHGHIIRAITQQCSRSTHCEPVASSDQGISHPLTLA